MAIMRKTGEGKVPFSRWLLVGFAAVAVAAVTTLSVCVFAFEGNAFADGLSVTASAPEEGSSDAPVKGEFWVEFDHNVAAVAQNKSCVELQTAAGKKVPSSKWSVELPDEQIEFGLRKHVIVKVKGLDAGKEYRIHLDAGLASKNGATLGTSMDISFTTAAKGAKAATLAEPAQAAAGSGNGDGTGGGTAGSAATSSDADGGVAANSTEVTDSDASADGSGSSAASGKADDADAANDSEDASAQDEPDKSQQVPAGTVAMLFVIAIVLVAAWVLRWRKAQGNAPKRQ